MKPLPMCLVWECPDCRRANTAGMSRCAKCGRLKPVFGVKPADPPEDTAKKPKPPKMPILRGFASVKTKGVGMQTGFVQSMMPKTEKEGNRT